jgi:oligopeptide/dipeptide ABC transporter ATP-binding protein
LPSPIHILTRLLQIIPTFLLIMVVVLVLVRLPYTQALPGAAPELDPTRRTRTAAIRGELPSPVAIPSGCPFHPRCPHEVEACHVQHPLLGQRPGGGLVACHLATPPVSPTAV